MKPEPASGGSDPSETAPLNARWAKAVVSALATAGVRWVCISPGSRSTPLTLAAAAQPELKTIVHFDERSAGFFALGVARASGMPAALICTSGSAGAHYLPAVIEAAQDRVPMVILTADRPPELRDTGAWQTIDQIKLYGGFVRWFAELSPPTAGDFNLRYAVGVARRAVHVARAPIPGPVHLNLPFREPLVAEGIGWYDVPPPGSWEQPSGPAPASPAPPPSDALVETLAARIADAPMGLILAGRHHGADPDYADAIAELATVTAYPILAEPAGGLRYGIHDRSQVITGYDAVLRDPGSLDLPPPNLVLRFGASFTWKHVAQYLARQPRTAQVVIDPLWSWDDPTRLAEAPLRVDPIDLARALVKRLKSIEGFYDPRTPFRKDDAASTAWNLKWRSVAQETREARRALLESGASGSVAWVYPALLELLPDTALLHAANSMAVRDLDTFTGPSAKNIRVLTNRGAAGIDGTISSALGEAMASGLPTTLVTGDLAFLHDLNGLAAEGAEGADLTILVINDGGGGIFAHLPVAEEEPERFERFFRTPPDADLKAACKTYRIPHARAEDAFELAQEWFELAGRKGIRVIELPLEMSANTRAHRRYWSDVAERFERLRSGSS